MGMFASLKMLFVFVFLGVPAALVGIPWSALRGNFRTMYRWGMGSIRLGLKAAGIRVSYDEVFYIAPKSQVAGAVREAA